MSPDEVATELRHTLVAKLGEKRVEELEESLEKNVDIARQYGRLIQQQKQEVFDLRDGVSTLKVTNAKQLKELALNKTQLDAMQIGNVELREESDRFRKRLSEMKENERDSQFRLIQYKSRYQVHDPQNDSSLGDQVDIVNCRPMSKTKRWRLIEILERQENQD